MRFIGLLCLAALPCVSQDPLSIVRAWQPSGIGDRWVYVGEMRTGTRAQPEIESREQNEVVVAVETVPQGTLIRRKVEYRNMIPVHPYKRPNTDADILVRKNCIYFMRADWGLSPAKITPDSLPNVCFPLRAGMTWGDPKKGRDLWTVAGMGKKHPDDPVSITPDSWRLEAHLASGDDNYVWFRKGIGVVAERNWHNGTYTDESVRLVRFERAPRR